MKTAIHYLFAICILLSCSLACNNYDKNAKQDSKSINQSEPTLCKIDTHFKIPADSATIFISKYDQYLDSLKKTGAIDSKPLIKGVRVKIDELYELVCAVKGYDNSNQYSLFIMNGIKPDGTDMVFMLQSDSNLASGTTGGTDPFPWYFDFTSPCPPSCPK
jgi:hypothetical protein